MTKHFGTAALEGFGFDRRPTARPSAPPARCSTTWPKRRKRRSATSTGCCRYRAGSTLRDRRSDAPQPGAHAHAARRPPRRLAAGGHRPHGHADGLAAAGRLAGHSADRHRGRSTRGSTPSRSWSPTPRWRPTCASSCAASTTSSGCWPASRPAGPARAILSFVGRTLRGLPQDQGQADGPQAARCSASSKRELDLCPDLRAQLEAALVDDCPLTSREGGFIRAGFTRRARRAARAGRRRQAVDRPLPGRGDRSGPASPA